MEKLEFYNFEDEVWYKDEEGCNEKLTDNSKVVSLMIDRIEQFYPKAYKALCDEYGKCKPNLQYYRFKIVNRFCKCNFGNIDNVPDVRNGIFSFERASDVSEIINEIPVNMRKLKGVLLDINKHPMDKYYQKEYTGFVNGAMYNGNIVSVHLKYNDKVLLKKDILHEIGHNIDKYSATNSWIDAMKKDAKFVSEYAKKANSEDFAETFSILFMEPSLRTSFPNRWKIIEMIYNSLK